VRLTFNGRDITAHPGQSVAAALVDAGIRSWRTTRKDARPRGLFCGIGVCYDCLITVDGTPNRRACLVPAAEGMQLTTDAQSPAQAPRDHRADGVSVDIAVVGAGPAGLAAAVSAAECGTRVAVIDAAAQIGGQYWRHPDESAPRGRESDGHHDWDRFDSLRSRFHRYRAAGRITYIPSSQVWFIEPAGSWTLHLVPADHGESTMDTVTARRLILCPGGYDRQLPIPGWDLPGVMAAGGVQALLKGHRGVAGRRAVVAGTGPFLLPVAEQLAKAGAEVVAVCEANQLTGWARHAAAVAGVPAKILEGTRYAAALARWRIPYRIRTAVTRINADDSGSRVGSVQLSRLDANGRVLRSLPPTEVDLVALGWGFTPSMELVSAVQAETRLDVDQSLVAVVDDSQRSTTPGVYVAGEATGVGGALLAVAEGELAGIAAADAEPARAGRVRRLRRRIRRLRAFAAAMHTAHPVPANWYEWLTAQTTLCRCEEVSVETVRRARDELGATDARTVKLLARPGMGWCQGHVCGFATAALAAAADNRPLAVEDLRSLTKQALCAPVTLALLADAPIDT
jgi:D-hydroxyproline dehydrogenase subunit alpha